MQDFSKEQILSILNVATDVKKALHDNEFNEETFISKYGSPVQKILENKKVATLFLENSTRTNFSFRAAVMQAGGNCDGFPSKEYTSLKKGETWADTVAMFAGYGYDAIVMRSTIEGLPRWTKETLNKTHKLISSQHKDLNVAFSYKVPMVVNGGDGKNQHPTQCFLDLFTIREIAQAHGKSLDHLKISLLNDLAYGRTNASLMSIAHLFNFELHLAYPPRFGPRESQLANLQEKQVKIIDHKQNFQNAMAESFIAYHSRPQKERVGKGEDLITIKKIGQIDQAMYRTLGEEAPYLLHPLPVDAETFEEISSDMLHHPKNMTKLQSSNGLYVRIALLAIGLGKIPLLNNQKTEILHGMSIENCTLSSTTKTLENPRSGFIEDTGVVIDHLPAGIGRRLAGVLGFENEPLPKVISDYVPVNNGKAPYKDLIKLHASYTFSPEQFQAIALLAPNAKISYITNGKVTRKVIPVIGNYIKDRISCGNLSCVTNVKKEKVVNFHHLNEKRKVRCNYCDQSEPLSQVYKENRYKYIKK
ncbi:hypothetical protein HOC32_03005 [Candidatus Woesearchaeota archaeon]|nr:hypothetical protein [Candidatus Woesearchaeota archaeon]